ncbi:MAG: hypothetical protein GF418_17430 [Chitinivibrionales bacterium]|nr:hypothetical protein [Chitinivibrionales bacterium]MBD3397403.1 hypothetical protein [Chitinivibrionales bacterium]
MPTTHSMPVRRSRTSPVAAKRILVYVQNKPFLGALLVKVPFLVELAGANPGARIELLSPVPDAALLKSLGLVHACTSFGNNHLRTLAHALAHFKRYDLAICMRPASQITTLYAHLSGKRTMGFLVPGGLPFRDTVAYDKSVYIAISYLKLLFRRESDDALRARVVPAFSRVFGDTASPDAGTNAVCLFPGAGQPFKRWPAPGFAGLVAGLGPAYRYHVIVGPDERSLAETIRENASVPCELHVGEDLRRIFALARAARLCIGNDCGPGHIGLMAGVPNLKLFPPGQDPAQWFFPRAGNMLIEGGRGGIGSIPVDRVLSAARAMLEGR